MTSRNTSAKFFTTTALLVDEGDRPDTGSANSIVSDNTFWTNSENLLKQEKTDKYLYTDITVKHPSPTDIPVKLAFSLDGYKATVSGPPVPVVAVGVYSGGVQGTLPVLKEITETSSNGSFFNIFDGSESALQKTYGFSSLNMGDINASGFGVTLQLKNNQAAGAVPISSVDIFVDCIRLQVKYQLNIGCDTMAVTSGLGAVSINRVFPLSVSAMPVVAVSLGSVGIAVTRKAGFGSMSLSVVFNPAEIDRTVGLAFTRMQLSSTFNDAEIDKTTILNSQTLSVGITANSVTATARLKTVTTPDSRTSNVPEQGRAYNIPKRRLFNVP